MSKNHEDNTDKKWYQKSWYFVKKAAVISYKALTSNTGAIIIAGLGLGLGIVTGGAAPIAIAAVVLAVKGVKTGIDAAKAIKNRNLDIENTALVDYATALCVRQKILDLQPRLQDTSKNLTFERDSKLSNKEKLKHDHSLEIAGKIVSVVNAGLDIATVALNPIKGIEAIKHVKTGLEVAERIKTGFEIAGSAGELMGAVDGTKELTIMLKEKISQHPEIREQLVHLINSERNRGDVGYDSIEELREQTRKIQIENKAYLAVMKEDNFYHFKPEQIKAKFQEYLDHINQETAPVKNKESFAIKLLHGIKDALNPYSKYNPNNKLNTQKHSGLTEAVRKENETIKLQDTKAKPALRTKDDMDIILDKGKEKIVVDAAQKKVDIERFKRDSEMITKRMESLKGDLDNVKDVLSTSKSNLTKNPNPIKKTPKIKSSTEKISLS